MESRFQRLFLAEFYCLFLTVSQRFLMIAALLCSLNFVSSSAFAADDKTNAGDDELGKIITPDIKRRTVKEDKLDTEDFELGLFYGLLSIEDFGTSPVQGITLDYHITERFFMEANVGLSKVQKTSYELLSGGLQLLTEDQRNLSYYNLNLGYNLLPGQVYITKKIHFDTNIYFIGGAGNTHFADKNYFTYNFGAGLRFYGTDWLALDLSMREYSFTHEIFGLAKKTNNLEGRMGLSIFF
jgi:outer membrane beta-barrel protein